MNQLPEKSWYSKAFDWGWLILVIIGIVESNFVWYAFAMIWGGGRVFVNIVFVDGYIDKASTLDTTPRDLWFEQKIAYSTLRHLLSAVALLIIFAGFAFGSIFHNQNTIDKAVEEVCVFEEQLDWEHNAKLASAIQNVCQSRRGYTDE